MNGNASLFCAGNAGKMDTGPESAVAVASATERRIGGHYFKNGWLVSATASA
jgi:hypothetical protein